jgi:hypothetical protein
MNRELIRAENCFSKVVLVCCIGFSILITSAMHLDIQDIRYIKKTMHLKKVKRPMKKTESNMKRSVKQKYFRLNNLTYSKERKQPKRSPLFTQ